MKVNMNMTLGPRTVDYIASRSKIGSTKTCDEMIEHAIKRHTWLLLQVLKQCKGDLGPLTWGLLGAAYQEKKYFPIRDGCYDLCSMVEDWSRALEIEGRPDVRDAIHELDTLSQLEQSATHELMMLYVGHGDKTQPIMEQLTICSALL